MNENYHLAKWLAGEMNDSELSAFKLTPEYNTYSRINEVSGQLESPHFEGAKMYNEILENKKSKGKVIPLYNSKWIRIAALIIVFLGVAFVMKSTISETEHAANGEQNSFTLPDNSYVVLNSGSEIKYKKWNWDNERIIKLDGEAYFKVAKGKTFEVGTSLGKVTVLGTQFNVKSRNNRFDVICYEGRVRVNYNNQETVISKGQRLSFTDGNAIDIPATDASQPEWLDNEMAFIKESLTGIVSELSRQYDIEIELNGVVSEQLFTGTLPSQNLDEALEVLSLTYHLHPIKVKDKIILEAVDVEE